MKITEEEKLRLMKHVADIQLGLGALAYKINSRSEAEGLGSCLQHLSYIFYAILNSEKDNMNTEKPIKGDK